MEYQLKNDSVEAWKIGSEPVPAWVAELVDDRTIRGKVDAHASFSIGTDDGPKDAQTGDYITYQPTVWGEPTVDAPQGEILGYRSVKLIAQAEFQKLYDVPGDELAAAPPVDEHGLVANGEAARPLTEAEKAEAVEAQPLDRETQPFAAQPAAFDAFESEKPKRRK